MAGDRQSPSEQALGAPRGLPGDALAVVTSWRWNFFAEGVLKNLPAGTRVAVVHVGKTAEQVADFRPPRHVDLVAQAQLPHMNHCFVLNRLVGGDLLGDCRARFRWMVHVDHDLVLNGGDWAADVGRLLRNPYALVAAHRCAWQLFTTFPWFAANWELWEDGLPAWDTVDGPDGRLAEDTGQVLGRELERTGRLRLVDGWPRSVVYHVTSFWHFRGGEAWQVEQSTKLLRWLIRAGAYKVRRPDREALREWTPWLLDGGE